MQIEKLEEDINERLEELSSLKAMYGLRGQGLSERVQTSPKGDGLEMGMVKCMELEGKIKAMVERFALKKHKIIGQIQGLKDDRHAKVLYRRYVRYMGFEEMAMELGYSYDHVKRLHRKALKEFERCHPMPL